MSGAEAPPVRQNRLTGGGERRSRRSRHTPVACAYPRPARCRAMAQIVRPSRCAHTTNASPPRPRHSASIAVGAARQPPSIGNGRGSRSPLKAWPGKRRWQRVDLRAALSVATEVNFVPLADDLTRPCADGRWTADLLASANCTTCRRRADSRFSQVSMLRRDNVCPSKRPSGADGHRFIVRITRMTWVELRRFELLTSCMPCKRSTN